MQIASTRGVALVAQICISLGGLDTGRICKESRFWHYGILRAAFHLLSEYLEGFSPFISIHILLHYIFVV